MTDVREWALAWRNSTSSNLRIYEILEATLGTPNTLSAAASAQVSGAAWRPDNGIFVVGQTSSPHTSFRTFDPETGDVGANTAISGGPDAITRDFSFSADGLRMVMAHNRNGTGDFLNQSLSLWAHDPEANSFTLLDTYDGGVDSRASRISPDGRWIIHENDVNNSRFRVVEVVGDTLIERGQLQLAEVGRVEGAQWYANSTRVVVEWSGASSTTARIVDIDSSGVPTIGDDGGANVGGPSGSATLSAAETTLVVGGAVTPGAKVFSVGNEGFTDLHTIPTVQVRHPGWNQAGSLFVGADSINIRLFSWDGETSALLDTDAWSSTVQGIAVARVSTVIGPQTPQEVFAAQFADASARDPKVTSLIRPGDTQKGVNTLGHYYLQKPKAHDPRAIVRLGELHLAQIGKIVKLQTSKWGPNLEEGAYKRIMGVEIDPRSEVVQFHLEGPDDAPTE